MVGATPYKLFLRVPWVNKQLASSDFTFRKRQKVAGVKYDKKWCWENILTPFKFLHSQLLKMEAAMAFWALAWQKTSSVQTCLVFKPKNHSKSFLGAYECKLQSRFCPLGHSSAVVAVVFVVIEKTGSPVFFLSFLH